MTAYIIDTGILDTYNEFKCRVNQAYYSAGGSNIDFYCHVTHAAGTIGTKTYGVAPKSKLVRVKVLRCSGFRLHSGVVAGINWVITNATDGHFLVFLIRPSPFGCHTIWYNSCRHHLPTTKPKIPPLSIPTKLQVYLRTVARAFVPCNDGKITNDWNETA